ncbi:MAG: ComF family protein [Clostridia bacterium]|nr:ComF family protein [Clostridia bacterium]
MLFPEKVLCLGCESALGEDDEDGICPACRRALDALAAEQETWEKETHDVLPEGIAYVHSAFAYDAQARTLVRLLKYRSIRAAALPLAKGMAMLPAGEEELIVPVPTDERRRKRRGFNQATLIANHLAVMWGMPVLEALVRVRPCAPQTGLNEQQRRENLVDSMAVSMRSVGQIRRKRVLLIDDVYTTGSTAAEAARALLDAGAMSVGILTAARAHIGNGDKEVPFLAQYKHAAAAEKRKKPRNT